MIIHVLFKGLYWSIPVDESDRDFPRQDGILHSIRASDYVFPHVPQELFLARYIGIAGPTGTVVGVDRNFISGREGHKVIVLGKGSDDELSPFLDRRGITYGGFGVDANPGSDPAVLAIRQKAQHDVDSRLLQGAHEVVVIFGRIDGIQADCVHAEFLQISNIFGPPFRELVRVEIDVIGLAQGSIVRAWIVCDSLDWKVFVG